MSEELVVTLILAALLLAALFGKARGRAPGLPKPKPERRARRDGAEPGPGAAAKPVAMDAALRRAAAAPHGAAAVSLLRAVLAESKASATPPGGARIVDHAGAHQGYALSEWAENAPYLHVFAAEPAGGVDADLLLSYGVKGQVFGYAAVIVETRRDRLGRPSDRATAVASARETALTKACLLYTSPSPRDRTRSRMPSSA